MFDVLIHTMPLSVCGVLTIEMGLSLLKKRDRALCWLALWSATATVLYLCHMLYFEHITAAFPISDIVYVVCNLAVYPLYLIYLSELTQPKPLSKRRAELSLLLGIPLLGGVVAAALYGLMSQEDIQQFVEGYLYHGGISDGATRVVRAQCLWHNVCRVLFAIGVVVVMTAGLRLIRHYNHMVTLFYADAEDRQMHSVFWALLLLVVTSLASVAVNFMGRYFFVDSIWLAVPSFAFSFLLLFLGWTGLQTTYSIKDILPADSAGTSSGEEEAPLSPAVIKRNQQLQERLQAIMDEERLYLQTEIKLDDVAHRLGTNRTYLLAMLSQQLQMSFSEYINRQRIAYAEQLMSTHPELSKTEVSLQSGYASPASFYRNYKLYKTKPEA